MTAPVSRTTPAAPVRALLVVLLTLVAAAALPAAAARASTADDDVTWTVRTASNDLGTDRTGFEYAVNPGSEVSDALVVTNRGTAALDLAVYAADGYTTESGQFDLLVPDRTSVGVGAWVHGAGASVRVEPGASADVPFTVSVPANATPGDYAGGIVTSLVAEDATEGITVDRRLGVRISLRVGGEMAPALAVEDPHVDYTGTLNPFGRGSATVTYTLHNTGNAVLSAQQGTTVAGPFGVLPATARDVDAPPQLLPGESWTVTAPVDAVAPTAWLGATVTVTPVLTDASGSTTSLDAVTVTTHGWAVPWTLLALVAALVAAAVLVPRLRARTRARRAEAEDARVQDAVARALADVEA